MATQKTKKTIILKNTNLSLKDIVSAKKYPDFIRKHYIFNKYKHTKKIFPSIGLDNVREPFFVISHEMRLTSLARKIKEFLRLATPPWRYDYRRYKYFTYKRIYLSEKLIKLYATYRADLNNIEQSISKNPTKFIQGNKLVNVIKLKTIPNAQGHLLTTIVSTLQNKIKYLYTRHRAANKPIYNIIDSEFEKSSNTTDKYEVVFSSSGEQGIWDIATMSMRGITSCQRWTAGHKLHLIGSIIDPFVGIIYITDGKQYGRYGKKMLARALVRYVIGTNKKPALLLERIYPFIYNDGYRQPKFHEAASIFVKFLKKYTKNKLPVIRSPYQNGTINRIPLSAPVKLLSHSIRSYRDSGIGYSPTINVQLNKQLVHSNS